MTKLVLVRHGESECFGSCPAERLHKYELVFKRISEKVWAFIKKYSMMKKNVTENC